MENAVSKVFDGKGLLFVSLPTDAMILWDWSGKHGFFFCSWYERGSPFPPFLYCTLQHFSGGAARKLKL